MSHVKRGKYLVFETLCVKQQKKKDGVLNKSMIMDNFQKNNSCINIPRSQTYRGDELACSETAINSIWPNSGGPPEEGDKIQSPKFALNKGQDDG